MKKLFLILAILCPLMAIGQVRDSSNVELLPPSHEALNSDWVTHMSVGTGFSINSFDAHTYTFVAPSFGRQLNNKTSVHGGFAMVLDNANKFRILGYNGLDLAPRRSTTMLASGHVALRHQLSERLWIAGSFSFLGGEYDPFWNLSGKPLNVRAFDICAALGYTFQSGSSINLYMHFVKDQAGTLPPWMFSPYHNYYSPYSPYSPWGCYSGWGTFGCDPFAPLF